MKKKALWNLYPKEPIEIKSIVEIAIFVCILCLCFFLYKRWNTVPTKDYYIQAESCYNLSQIDTARYNGYFCNVYITNPMTFNKDLIESNKPSILINIWAAKDIRDMSIERYKQYLADTIRNSLYGQYKGIPDEFEFSTYENILRFARTHYSYNELSDSSFLDILFKLKHISRKYELKDSLTQVFKNRNLDTRTPLFYIANRESLPYSPFFIEYVDSNRIESGFIRKGLSNNYLWNEAFVATDSIMIPSHCTMRDKSIYTPFNPGTPLDAPYWGRLEDISQAYVNLHIASLTIDSMNVKLNFGGATEFSSMKPSPDVITVNSIEFHDPEKIAQIRSNGLHFHAKFVELSNFQQMRLVLVSSLIGGIVIALIGFFILLYFKIKRGIFNATSGEKDKREYHEIDSNTNEKAESHTS